MTDMIQIDRDQFVNTFAEFFATAAPASNEYQIDARKLPQLADVARALVADGSFRNKTELAASQDALAEQGFSDAEVLSITEIALQMGRAVNAAFMNASGVYSSTAKLFNVMRPKAVPANDDIDFDLDEHDLRAIGDDEIDEELEADGLIWDDLLGEYVPADLKDRPADPTGVSAAIERTSRRFGLVG